MGHFCNNHFFAFIAQRVIYTEMLIFLGVSSSYDFFCWEQPSHTLFKHLGNPNVLFLNLFYEEECCKKRQAWSISRLHKYACYYATWVQNFCQDQLVNRFTTLLPLSSPLLDRFSRVSKSSIFNGKAGLPYSKSTCFSNVNYDGTNGILQLLTWQPRVAMSKINQLMVFISTTWCGKPVSWERSSLVNLSLDFFPVKKCHFLPSCSSRLWLTSSSPRCPRSSASNR